MDELWCSVVKDRFKSEDKLNCLLRDLLIGLQTSKTFHPEALPRLMKLLDEHHIPEVHVATCTLISCLCSSSGSFEANLDGHNVLVISLCNLLKSTVQDLHPKPLQVFRLKEQLIEHITSLLRYFSSGFYSSVNEFIGSSIMYLLASLVDANSCLLSVKDVDAANHLKLLISVDRKFVGKRQIMSMQAATRVYFDFFGPECELNFPSSQPFVVDMFDTSTCQDVHLVDRLSQMCGNDKVWLYDDECEDPDISDPENDRGSWADVRVTQVIDGAYFWAVLGRNDINTFDNMCHQLEATVLIKSQVDAAAMEKSINAKTALSQLVYVLHDRIGWYRAQVIAVVSWNSVRVFAIDRGFIETVSLEELYLPDNEDPLKSIPSLSHLCKLKGMRPLPSNREIFINALETLCNVTSHIEFLSTQATGQELSSETGLPFDLLHLAECPDVEIQIIVLRIYSNLARVAVWRPLVMKSGICIVVLDVIKKNRSCAQTTQWTHLMETCALLIGHLVHNCAQNKDEFIEMQGVHTLSLLCESGSPESVRLAAARAISIFIGEVTSDFDADNSRDTLVTTSGNSISSVASTTNLLLDIADHSGGIVHQSSQRSQKNFNFGEHLTLQSDQHNELQTDSVERINRDTVTELICAFLNNPAGGSIYYGIQPCDEDSGSYVRGVKLTHSLRDRLRLSIDKLVVQCITPTVAPGTVVTNIHNVLDPLTGDIVSDLRVIELAVVRPPSLMPTLYTCVYGIERHGFIRFRNSTKKLTSKDIYAWTIENMEKAMIGSILHIQQELALLRSSFQVFPSEINN